MVQLCCISASATLMTNHFSYTADEHVFCMYLSSTGYLYSCWQQSIHTSTCTCTCSNSVWILFTHRPLHQWRSSGSRTEGRIGFSTITCSPRSIAYYYLYVQVKCTCSVIGQFFSYRYVQMIAVVQVLVDTYCEGRSRAWSESGGAEMIRGFLI